MFETIHPAPPDAILGLTEAFKNDENSDKINLGVGVFKDDTGITPVLNTVKAAEEKILASENTKSYLPMPGEPVFGTRVQELLFGEGHGAIGARRAKTAHTPGGTGALRVGADFLKKFRPEARIWVSTPTWANHKGIFGAAGMATEDYPYYNPETMGLDFEGMIAALAEIPAEDIVLLHACCHNPTGVDLSPDQWKEVARVAGEKGWLPFVDFAYQGFGTSLEADREGIVELIDAVPELLVASSFSKNIGLYRERTGAFTLLAENGDAANAAFSHVKLAIRTNYSNPPAHGGLIARTILEDAGLREQWVKELDGMRDHIAGVRASLVDGLKTAGVDRDFSFIAQQRGMFSFSGLSDVQVDFLREKKSIYIVKGGRINVAGVTSRNIEYLCASIKESLSL
ncbi:MAG: amino acid aminotransferase [Verrucomicrobiota bacterium]